ncbi:hypothetical protein AB4Y87_17630 [Paenarthrobacter sp. RAF54_2]|uniref:hypothetical protein n=1 Tax=Paenarthrobacter sp. RAF54_2 TaxID=3233061 RepID=UPI003F9BE619
MISESTFLKSTSDPTTRDDLDAAYVGHLLSLQRTLRLPTLASDLGEEAVWRVNGLGDGLTTVAFRTTQVEVEVLRAVLGFRLAEFLNLGLMSASLARTRNLFHEPVEGAQNTIHAVCLDKTGRILGYIAMVGALQPKALLLDGLRRELFPVEVAHGVDLLSRFANIDLTTHHTWEVKRFVRASGLPPGGRRDRIPWHLILALGRTAHCLDDVRVLIGDSREHGALHHLRLLGFDPLVLPDTKPSLPRDYLMWPSYEGQSTARPFASLLPRDLDTHLDFIEQCLKREQGDGWQRKLLGELRASVRRPRNEGKDESRGSVKEPGDVISA